MEQKSKKRIDLGLSLFELIQIYIILLVIFICAIGIVQESISKGTIMNRAIRHHFGLEYFSDYASKNLVNLTFDEEVPDCDYKTMTSKQFFNEFVSKYRPCRFKGYATIWPAYDKWKNETYLLEQAGNEIIYAERQTDNRFAYFTDGAKRVYLTYGDFLEKFKEENRTYHYYYSFEDPPGVLKEDMINPPIMDSLFKLTKVTFWQGYGTLTKPHTDSMENMMCILVGSKNFTIVHPQDRKFVYPGYSGLPDNYSPVEFVFPDYTKWPEFRNARVKSVYLATGDCLYMPAYWWHQVGSSPGVTIGVATWYETHHASLDVTMMGMQRHIF